MTYKECREYIKSDYYRFTGRKNDSMLRMWLRSHIEPGFHFLFWWRLSHIRGGYAMRLITRHLGIKYHINIERSTDIGYGFWIVHGGPIVINSSAHIGNNCQIYQYSTIGSSCLNGAEIGDNVYIGPSVCIVEGVKIGDGATIGAGAVVVHDVPAGATVAGNPAKVISWKEPGRLVYNRWKVKG